VEELIYAAALAGGFGLMWWQRIRLNRRLDPSRLELAEDGEIALHLARHEAESRDQPLAPLHILYALVQDEQVAATIGALGGDVDALEDRVLAALASPAPGPTEHPPPATRLIAWAVYMANRADRRAGCADLWGGMVQTAPETAALVDASGVDASEVLFRFVHGEVDPAPPSGRVAVVLVNDDISSQDLVIEILRDIFELDADAATARMLEAHNQGRGEIGRFGAREAAGLVDRAHRRARSRGAPLYLRLQPI
jgi:ATP-dependent Clp protease adapter protein ClpS